jgi:transcriptional regulator with XRE-family HTH domain
MTSTEYGKILSKNLKRIAYENQKTQADIARDLGLKQVTVSSWMNGTRVPRMDKIDLLCHYFNCKRSDLMEEHPDGSKVDFVVSDQERNFIIEFRKADDLTKQMMLRLLKIEDAIGKNSPKIK